MIKKKPVLRGRKAIKKNVINKKTKVVGLGSIDVGLLVRACTEQKRGQSPVIANKGESAAANRLVTNGYLIKGKRGAGLTGAFLPTKQGFKIVKFFATALTELS